MDLKDTLKQLSDRVLKLKEQIHTEEATKTAFVMPFIQALGYDVFNPLEVVPEFISDIGTKKGEKIDYAILKDTIPTILIECKHWNQNLDVHDGQLLRYFHVSRARFGILTNGILYRFYTDLAEPNKMDEKPFLEFNLADLRDNQIEELKKFHKSYFDVDNIITTASELKYTNELKNLINNEFTTPSENFVKHFARQVYPGMITQKVLDQFTNLTRRSISHYISDLITERLKSALSKESENNAAEPVPAEVSESISKIVTTAEELECFLIVKSILRQRVEVSRIAYRDAQSYFSILLDDNNRKTICRLYLNGTKKQLGIFDEQKKETKFEFLSLDDLFTYSDQLVAAIDFYEKVKETV
ncbi:MAG: type I restriction enzyme HsdR N-terminal domain-containing protein [Bacteroidia bacterium]|nr:type I restriction enzyme HsdR N-terminal domain-containing protein [Bacteroidia bacterium]